MDINTVWDSLDKAGIITGLITAIPVFYSAFALWQLRKKEKQVLRKVREDPGSRPTVLIIDVRKVGAGSIQTQVENWLRQQEGFQDFPAEAIYTVEFEGEMYDKDVDKFIPELRQRIGQLMVSGTDKLHLFIRAPTPVTIMTGEILSNAGCPVLVYHNQPNVGYQNWGMLHRL